MSDIFARELVCYTCACFIINGEVTEDDGIYGDVKDTWDEAAVAATLEKFHVEISPENEEMESLPFSYKDCFLCDFSQAGTRAVVIVSDR